MCKMEWNAESEVYPGLNSPGAALEIPDYTSPHLCYLNGDNLAENENSVIYSCIIHTTCMYN